MHSCVPKNVFCMCVCFYVGVCIRLCVRICLHDHPKLTLLLYKMGRSCKMQCLNFVYNIILESFCLTIKT